MPIEAESNEYKPLTIPLYLFASEWQSGAVGCSQTFNRLICIFYSSEALKSIAVVC
jgi:hypothetical protein